MTKKVPLQIWVPLNEAKAIKSAAMRAKLTNSDFLLSCFREATAKKSNNLAMRIHNRFAQIGITELPLLPDGLAPPAEESPQ